MALVRKLQPGAKTTGKTMRYENVGTYDAEEFIKALTQANRSGYSFTNELFNTLLNAIRNGDVSKNADGSWTINNNPSLINVYDSGKESGATKDTGWGYDTYDGSPDKNHGIFTSKGTRKQRKLDQSLGELFLFADTVRNNLLTNEAKAEKATVEPDKNNYNGAALLNSIMSARYGGDNNWKALLEQEDAKTRYSLIGQAMSDYANNNGNLLDYYNNQKWSNTNFGNYDKFFEAYKLAIEQLNNGVDADNNAFTNLGFGSLKSLFAVPTKPAEQTIVGNHETDWKKAKSAELKNLFPSIEEAKIEELVNSEYAKYIKQQLENYNKLQSGNDFDLNFYPKVQEILNTLPQYSFNFGTASPILAENTVVKEENDLKGYTINTLRSKTGELTNIIPLVLIEGRINENISPELKSKFWQALTGRALTVFDYIKTYPDDIPMLVYNYNANSDWSQQEYIIPNTYDDKTYSFLTYAPNTNTIVRRNAPKEFLRREPYENWKTSQEVPSLKEGGIIKAEYGIKFAAEDNFNTFLNSKISTAPPAAKPVKEKSFLQQMLTDNLRNDELKLAGQREVGGTTEGNYFEPSKEIEFSPRDYWLLSNVAADVTAALSAFIPGYGTATSAALGLGSTISQAGFDYTDDSQSFLSATGNTALNLGMDLIGLIPFLGTSSKGLKVVKTLAKSPKLITALVGVASANAIPGGIEAFRKITSGETLTVDDYRAIGATAQLVIGGWGAHLNYKAKNKFEGTTNYIDKEVKTSKGAVSLPVDEIEQIKAATNGKNLTLEELLKLQNEVYKQIQLRKGVAEKDIATLTIPYSDKSIRHARMSTTSPETGQNTPQHIPYTPDNPTGWKRYFNNDVAFGPVHGKRQVSTVNDTPTVNSTNIDGVAHLPEGLTNGTKVKVGALNATIIGYNSGTGEYKIQTSNGFDIVPASKKSATKVTQSDYKVGDKVTLEDGSSATIKKVNSDGKFEIEKSGSLETIESGKIKSKVEIIPKSLRTVLDDTAEQAAKTIGSTPESVTKAIALKAVETAKSNTNLAELNVILNEYGLNAIQRDAVAKAINTKLTTNPNATIDDALWNRTELPGLKPAPLSRLTSSQINKGYTEPDLSMPAEGLLVINTDGSTRKARTRQLAEFDAYWEEVQQKAAEEKAQKAENKRQQELRRQQQVADLKLNLKDAKTKVTFNVKAFLDKVNQLRNSKAKQKLAEDSKNALTPPSKPQKKQNGGSLEFSREVIARRNGGLIFKYGKGDAIATIKELGENSKDDLTAYTLGDKKGILYSNTLGKYYVKDSTGKIYIITGDPKHYQGTILDNIILDGIKKGEIEEFTGTEFDLHYSNPGAYYMLQTELNKMLEPTLESLQVNDLLLLDIHSENKTWWVGNRQFVAKSNDEKDIKLAKESAERYAKATGLEVTINNLVTRDTPEAKWNIEDFTYMDRAKEQSSTLSRQATAGYTPNSRANALNMEQTDKTYKKFFNLFLRAKENGWESLREDERISAFNFLKKLDAYTFNNSTSGSQSHPVFKGEVGLLLDYDKLTETNLLGNWFDTVNSMMMDGPIGLWHTYPTLLEEKRGEKAAHWIKQADGSYTKAGDDFDATKYLLLHTDYSDDETDNWTDYYWKAKNVKVGSSGTTEQYTPNEKDLKAVYDKPFELPDIRLDNIVGAMRTAFLNRGNTKSYKAAIDWSPAMKDYIHRLELLEGDFAAKRASMDAGTRIMWEASKPRTTDARLQLAGDLQGTHYKNLYDMQGNAADSKRFYETRSRIMNLANEDLLYNTAKHDDNVAALSAYDQFKAQSKANLIQQNYTNWNNYFTGLLTQLAQGYDRQWQLAMDKAKTNYISNLSAQENAYEYNLKNINDQYAAGKLDAKQYQEAMDLAIKLKSLQTNKASEDYYNGSYNMVGPHLWTVPTANTRNKLDYFLDKKTGTYWKKDVNGKLTPYTLTSKNGSKIPKAAKGKKKGLKANDLFRLQSDKDFNKALRDFINNVYKSFRNKK